MTLTKKNTPYPHYEFLVNSTSDYLRIVPERGGLISEWFCNGKEMLYFDQERYRDSSKSIRGGIPILFPICGNLPGNILPLTKGDFTLNQHGFARDFPWELELLDDQNGIRLSLFDNIQTRLIYPFSFKIEIDLHLLYKALQINIRIQNFSDDIMLFSFGLHPYFKVSNLNKVRFEGFEAKCFNHINMSFSDTDLEIRKLNEGVDFLVRPCGPIVLIDETLSESIQIQYQHPLDLFVVWSDPPRNMVCLEPWTSPRGALVSGDRRLEIKPGSNENFRCRFTKS